MSNNVFQFDKIDEMKAFNQSKIKYCNIIKYLINFYKHCNLFY